MTVDEMKSKIKAYCKSRDWCESNDTDGCECPLWKSNKYNFCYECGTDIEGLKSNYEAIFGKPQFTLSDIKVGYLVRVRKDTLLIVIPQEDGIWWLYDKDDDACSCQSEYRDDMTNCDDLTEYDIMEVYGLSSYGMFDPDTRELLYKREEIKVEEVGTKLYTISNIDIAPNFKSYDTKQIVKPVFVNVDDGKALSSLTIDETKELAKSLQEIVDYVEGVK